MDDDSTMRQVYIRRETCLRKTTWPFYPTPDQQGDPIDYHMSFFLLSLYFMLYRIARPIDLDPLSPLFVPAHVDSKLGRTQRNKPRSLTHLDSPTSHVRSVAISARSLFTRDKTGNVCNAAMGAYKSLGLLLLHLVNHALSIDMDNVGHL